MGLRRRYTVMAWAPERRIGQAIDRQPQVPVEPTIDRPAETIEVAPTLDRERWFGTAQEADR